MSWTSYHTKEISESNLFKFLPLSKAELFLKSGEIWFSRADQFGDKLECVNIDDLSEGTFDYSKIEERKRKYLISCWHLADNEY